MKQSDHTPKHRAPLDVQVGDVFGSRDGGGSIYIQEMCQSPTDRSLAECDVSASQYATPVVLLLDHDIDGTPIDVVAFHGNDNAFRVRLIERAVYALETAREALVEARHVELDDIPLVPDNLLRATS